MKTERNPLYSKALSLDDIHDNVPFVVYNKKLNVPILCGVFSGEPFEDNDGIMKVPYSYWCIDNLIEKEAFLEDYGIVRNKQGAWNSANLTILGNSQGMSDFAREFNINIITFVASSVVDDLVAICNEKLGSIDILSRLTH